MRKDQLHAVPFHDQCPDLLDRLVVADRRTRKHDDDGTAIAGRSDMRQQSFQYFHHDLLDPVFTHTIADSLSELTEPFPRMPKQFPMA